MRWSSINSYTLPLDIKSFCKEYNGMSTQTQDTNKHELTAFVNCNEMTYLIQLNSTQVY